MSFFTKPVASLAFEDLEALHRDGATENLRLEFKQSAPDRDELLKKVTGFANSYGGRMIIGATEDKTTFSLAALPGVAAISGYDQKVAAWCAEGAFPPTPCSVSPPIRHRDAPQRVFYVLEIPESMEAPHFLNGRRGVYVRVADIGKRVESQLADFEEIMGLANRRQRAVDQRRALLARARARFHHLVGNGLCAAHLWACPEFPVRPLVTEPALRDHLDRSRFSWRQCQFPQTHEAETRHETLSLFPMEGNAGGGYLEVTTWGSLFWAFGLLDGIDGERGIHMPSFLGHLLAFIVLLTRWSRHTCASGALSVTLGLENILGTKWIAAGTSRRLGDSQASRLDPSVDIDLTVTVPLPDSEIDRLLRSVIQRVMFALNFEPKGSDQDAMVQMAKRFSLYM